MINEPITIINKYGLHTRAAAKLVATAAKFESTIELTCDNQVANCKSIMAVILLGATKGQTLNLIITGEDEQSARDEIIELINSKFGEAD